MSEIKTLDEYPKLTAELRKNLPPNKTMQDMPSILDTLKDYIKEGRLQHVCLLLTFDDGGSKYYSALADDKPLIIKPS